MKKLLLIITSILLLVSCRYVEDAQDTTFNEFKASALLKKYEYFKDLSAGIDKKRAEIDLYTNELKSMKVEDKEDKFYYQQRKSELLGLISIHNELCAQYNSAMSKFNYRFTNTGDLPDGGVDPLPREIKPYINNLNN